MNTVQELTKARRVLWALGLVVALLLPMMRFLVPVAESAVPGAPTSLLCEGATNPTNVMDTTPEFSAIGNDSDLDTDTIYGESADGYIQGTHSSSYSTARSTSTECNGGMVKGYAGQYWASGTHLYGVCRSYHSFDTSSVPDDATVSSAELYICADADGSNTDFLVKAYRYAWSEPLCSSRETNYDGAYGASSTLEGTFRDTSDGWVAGTCYSMTVASAGVNKSGDTKYVLVSEKDVNNSQPTNWELVDDRMQEYSGTNNDPYMKVWYPDQLTHAYVQVGTTAGGSDMWDSGWIDITDFTAGNRSPDISYDGYILSTGTSYYWRIKFKDNDGNEGLWSSNAQFTTKNTPDSVKHDIYTGKINNQGNPDLYVYADVGGDGTVHTVWNEYSGTDKGVWYANNNEDEPFDTQTQLFNGACNGLLDIDAVGDTVHVAWWDKEGMETLSYRRSTDGGETWEPTQQIVTSADLYHIDVVACNDDVFIFWYYSAAGELRYVYNHNGGASGSWSSTQDDNIAASWPAGSCENGTIYLGYSAIGGGASRDDYTHYRDGTFTTTGGITWDTEIKVGTSQTTGGNSDTELVHRGSYIHMVWLEGTDGTLMYSRSTNGGDSWESQQALKHQFGQRAYIALNNLPDRENEVYIGRIEIADDNEVNVLTNQSYGASGGWWETHWVTATIPGDVATVVSNGIVHMFWSQISSKGVYHAWSPLWYVAASTDDAYQDDTDGTVVTNGDTITLGHDGTDPQFAGFLFTDVTVPYTGVVVGAHLWAYIPTTSTDVITVELFTEDDTHDNGRLTFGSGGTPAERMARWQTSAEYGKYPGSSGYCVTASDAVDDYCGLWVEWEISANASGWVRSPNLAIIIQEQIGASDWDKDDELVIIVRPQPNLSDATRTVRAYDYGTNNYAPVLEIDWVENAWSAPSGLAQYGLAWMSSGYAPEAYTIGARLYSEAISWSSVEGVKGTYSWGGQDGWVEAANSAGHDIVAHFDYWPTWAHDESGSSRGVIDGDEYDDYEDFVGATVARYDGDPKPDIDLWGMANEPESSTEGRWASADNSYGLSCPNQLDHVYQHALTYLAVKRADSSDGVFYGRLAHNGAGSNEGVFLEKVMDYGAGSFMDLIAYHIYLHPNGQGYPCDEWDTVTKTLDTTCDSVKGVRDIISNIHGYSGSRAKAYMLTEVGHPSMWGEDGYITTAWTASRNDRQAQTVYRFFAQAAGENIPYICWHWFSDRSASPCIGCDGHWQNCDHAVGLKGWLDHTAVYTENCPAGGMATVYDDWADDNPPKAGPKPAYYTYWSFTHNLSDTITVSKMTTGASPGSYDLPTGYEGYLFKTDTITRAVVWNNDSTTDIYITVSGTGSDYVRIARATKIVEADADPVGDDGEGVGWAKCYDYGSNSGHCDDENGTDIWTGSWYDRDNSNNGKFKIDDIDAKEPFMIWSDDDDIEITW